MCADGFKTNLAGENVKAPVLVGEGALEQHIKGQTVFAFLIQFGQKGFSKEAADSKEIA